MCNIATDGVWSPQCLGDSPACKTNISSVSKKRIVSHNCVIECKMQ